jgi:hypothetical protein
MEDKIESDNELPKELKFKTAKNLSNRDLINWALTSKYRLSLFKPMLEVHKLLHYVTRGDHEAVKTMLKNDMSLIFRRGVITDCSGREFENLSPFEYALWALDKHMWAAMIACIPQNEEGRKVFAQLINQYNKVNTIGVTYKLNGKTITEQHFDFNNTLIKELQAVVDAINTPGAKDWDAIDKQWIEGVGGAQKLLPMHVVYEYCSDEPFYPVPTFTSPPKSSTMFYNWISEKDENWFGLDSKLGSDIAIHKGSKDGICLGGDGWGCAKWGQLAKDALLTLSEIRANDFINLKWQLEERVIADNQPQVDYV